MITEADISETRIPRYAIFNKKRVRVISYLGEGTFKVLDTDDSYRIVHRDRMKFVKPRRKS